MKPVALLLLTSSLMLATPAAFAQDACQNHYGACMDHCSSRPASMQEHCSQSCESQSNQCYVGVYGPSSPAVGEATSTPAASPEASDAHDEAKSPKKSK